jgi:hypothetical protein
MQTDGQTNMAKLIQALSKIVIAHEPKRINTTVPALFF